MASASRLVLRSLLRLGLATSTVVGALGGMGCDSVRSSGVATGPVSPAPRRGPVAVYMARPLPPGSREVGLVEARGTGENQAIDAIFPDLAQRAQELGANAIQIEWLGARYDNQTTYSSFTQMYPCGRTTCVGMGTMTPSNNEIVTVIVRGRAYLVPEGPP